MFLSPEVTTRLSDGGPLTVLGASPNAFQNIPRDLQKCKWLDNQNKNKALKRPGGAAKQDECFTLMFHVVIQGNSCVSLSTTGPTRITRDRVIGVLTKSATDDRSFI